MVVGFNGLVLSCVVGVKRSLHLRRDEVVDESTNLNETARSVTYVPGVEDRVWGRFGVVLG